MSSKFPSMRMKKVSLPRDLSQWKKRPSPENDDKTIATESTTSYSSLSASVDNANCNERNNDRVQREPAQHQTMSQKEGNDASLAQLLKIRDLQRSNQSLREENLDMKRRTREMEIRLDSMEQPLQRDRTQREQELQDVIGALRQVTKMREEELEACKKEQERRKSDVMDCDEIIGYLMKERNELKSKCLQAEKEISSAHKEVESLQEELGQSLEHANRLKVINRDLTTRLVKFEAQAQTRKELNDAKYRSSVDFDRANEPSSAPQFDASSSMKATEELQSRIEKTILAIASQNFVSKESS